MNLWHPYFDGNTSEQKIYIIKRYLNTDKPFHRQPPHIQQLIDNYLSWSYENNRIYKRNTKLTVLAGFDDRAIGFTNKKEYREWIKKSILME
tara:strand:- start:1215 stop:1490 length:276 start_codon:yes stop_codon:yes gene_type:complete